MASGVRGYCVEAVACGGAEHDNLRADWGASVKVRTSSLVMRM